jgi:hypothetical protein
VEKTNPELDDHRGQKGTGGYVQSGRDKGERYTLQS